MARPTRDAMTGALLCCMLGYVVDLFHSQELVLCRLHIVNGLRCILLLEYLE